MFKFNLVSGEWPHKNSFAVGAGFDTFFDVYPGDTLYLEINKRKHMVKIGGVLYEASNAPMFVNALQLYTTRQRFSQLTGQENFDIIQTRDITFNEAAQEQTDLAIRHHLDRLEIDSRGLGTFDARVVDPQVHALQNILDGLFFTMGVMGAATVILGLFLIYNTVNAIITGQINQIGVMKAIGGCTGQILWAYLVTIFIYGLLATVVAVPLVAIGAHYLALFLLNILNVETAPFTLDPLAMLSQLGVAWLMPLLASLFPLVAGVRISVREAIGSYGLEDAIGLVDRLVAKMQRVPYTILLTIGNTFRNKRRVVLIEMMLVSSGLIFMMVIGMRDSAIYTFTDKLTAIHTYDVTLTFESEERVERIEAMALSQPGVKAVEMWSISQAAVRPATQAKASVLDKGVTLFGLPLPATMYAPQLKAGRWLEPDDTYVVVLNSNLAGKVGVEVGDWVTFDHGLERESTWQVVGLSFDPLSNNSAHMPITTLQKQIGSVNRANTLWVQTTATTPEATEDIAQTLRHLYEARNITVEPEGIFEEHTIAGIGEEALMKYDIIVIVLAIMAVLIASVGGIGLSGVLSLSVLERQREVGVMRAIGASSSRVARIFIGEGLILGLLSWLLAIPFGIPAAYFLTTQGLTGALDDEIIYRFSPFGLVSWLIIVVILAIAASWFPARSATQISVRESLAYQ
jgi:putative ABC transport system permease protein